MKAPNKTKKAWYRSKTIWFNVLAIIVALATQFGYQGNIDPEFQQIGATVLMVGNLILRFKTNSPVGGKDEEEPEKDENSS